MHDLRKKTLLAESGKTVSRKARSKLTTPSTSRANSTTPSSRGSRVSSPNDSDEEGDRSDGTQWSTNSIDDLLAPAELDTDDAPEVWMGALADYITLICDRKGSSVQGREDTLARFIATLSRHYAKDEVARKVEELLPALIKSVKSGQTERETVLALKALALLLVTDPAETFYDAIQASVKSTIEDGSHPDVKVAAIHLLSIATFYGGASLEETQSIMDFLLEIVSTDGAVIEETDNAEIAIAALQEWGFLATQLEDIEEMTEAAVETFVDQLESSYAGVQIAAGENIALLYEKSYTEAESDDDVADGDNSDEENGGPRMVKRYTVYRQTHRLQQILTDLARLSSKRVSKKDRKTLHTTFSDILTTIDKPTRGPRYSMAQDDEGREYGSRLKITIHGGGKMTIDTWSKLHRLNGLKRLLQGGLMVHYEENGVVFDTLPVMIEG